MHGGASTGKFGKSVLTIGQQTVISRLTVGHSSVDCCPLVGRQSVINWPLASQQFPHHGWSTCWPTNGQLTVKCWQSVGH